METHNNLIAPSYTQSCSETHLTRVVTHAPHPPATIAQQKKPSTTGATFGHVGDGTSSLGFAQVQLNHAGHRPLPILHTSYGTASHKWIAKIEQTNSIATPYGKPSRGSMVQKKS